ncbi:hypothetical protein CUJ83_06195 [Methanocella sp. CWC-04]|uniref:Multifunctional fusion protein n=1 Tax=Methanooceanicella nereidis TaxID=2052831 RepID=A0AAP2RCI5_9EURY|nr:AAA family ATPase [Methanocella sp. CWC-04]MCD1294592.1 hypothetical protein [Methanocella sp. CWC-04]
MKVIAFVGMPGAGKSEASGVAREMGLPVIIMGDVLREEVKNRGLEPTDANIGSVANQLRKDEGMDAIAKRCIPKIESLEGNVVVIDGIRGIAEVETFKEKFGENFTLVKIDAPFELRLERLTRRARSDDNGTPEWLRQRDERELSWGMGKAIEVADKEVVNLDPIEKFREEIGSILTRESIETTVSVLVFPTEVEENVARAVENIFPGTKLNMIKQKGYVDRFEGKPSDLSHFHDLLRKEKILDTARNFFYKGLSREEKEISFELNKQAAFMGEVNFLDHDVALGGIYVTISHFDPEMIIDWLAPVTKDGRPVMEIEL